MPRITPRAPQAELAQLFAQRAKSPRQIQLDIQLEVKRIHARTQELRLATQRLIGKGPAV